MMPSAEVLRTRGAGSQSKAFLVQAQQREASRWESLPQNGDWYLSPHWHHRAPPGTTSPDTLEVEPDVIFLGENKVPTYLHLPTYNSTPSPVPPATRTPVACTTYLHFSITNLEQRPAKLDIIARI